MDQEKINQAVLSADTALKFMMEKNGYRVYEGSGGGQQYAAAVGALAAGILTAESIESK